MSFPKRVPEDVHPEGDRQKECDSLLDELIEKIHNLGLKEEELLIEYTQRIRSTGDPFLADKVELESVSLRTKGRLGLSSHTYVTQKLRRLQYRKEEYAE